MLKADNHYRYDILKFWPYNEGLKGSMRVRGPPPSQGIHIAKAVQEGMRAMFRGAASPTSRSVSDPSEGSITAAALEPSMQYEASDPSLLEEYVKVQNPS